MPVGNASYGITQHPGNDITRSELPAPQNPMPMEAQQPNAPPAEPTADYVQAAREPTVSPHKGA